MIKSLNIRALIQPEGTPIHSQYFMQNSIHPICKIMNF